MASRQTEIRRAVYHMIGELIMTNLEIGEFTEMDDWEEIFGFTGEELRAEIKRQALIMRDRASRP
jgi:hypothetical protein